MKCCASGQCAALDDVFDARYAADDLADYHKKGPGKTTRALLDAVRAHIDLSEKTLLDIGGGVGVIQHELFAAGLSASTGVDASRAFLQTAEQEAARRGHGERANFVFGDFVARADEIEAADIVTLERVVCCYPDMRALVTASADRARGVYALVLPRDVWWMRIAQHGLNLWERVTGSAFRFFVHSRPAIDTLLAERGFAVRVEKGLGVWQLVVYARAG
jgi:magnesium-protoporphyrin O-methyltransferase